MNEYKKVVEDFSAALIGQWIGFSLAALTALGFNFFNINTLIVMIGVLGYNHFMFWSLKRVYLNA